VTHLQTYVDTGETLSSAGFRLLSKSRQLTVELVPGLLTGGRPGILHPSPSDVVPLRLMEGLQQADLPESAEGPL
jgi:hypothetical protein